MFRISLTTAARIGIAVATLSFASRHVQAALVIDLQEVGSDVVATGSGTANLTALTFDFQASGIALIDPLFAVIEIGGPNKVDWYSSIAAPENFGDGAPSVPSFSTGPRWGVTRTALLVPTGYVSESLLLSTSTWNNKTLVELGVTPGMYTWTWGSGTNEDFLTLNVISAAAVPEPSSLAFLGLACLGFAARARRKQLRTEMTLQDSLPALGKAIH